MIDDPKNGFLFAVEVDGGQIHSPGLIDGHDPRRFVANITFDQQQLVAVVDDLVVNKGLGNRLSIAAGREAEVVHDSSSWTHAEQDVAEAVDNVVPNKTRYLDSTTSTGSTVSHGEYSTAIGSDDATIGNFQQATNTINGDDVIVHYSRPDYEAQGGVFVVDGNPTNS